MRVLAILGSRNPDGQTAGATDALLEGTAAEGWQTEKALLPQMEIQRCRQCEDSGWGICRSEGRCVIEDDLAGVVAKVRESDAVVFATPVYFSDLSESLRAFLDRLRRTCMHQDGKTGVEGKACVGICVAGGGGGGAPACCASLEKVLSRCGFDVLDVIPVRRQNLPTKLETLKATGRGLASGAMRLRSSKRQEHSC